MKRSLLSAMLLLAVFAGSPALAQLPPPPPQQGRPAGFGGPITLGPDDVQTLAEPAHDPTHWRNNLYHFLQKVFQAE